MSDTIIEVHGLRKSYGDLEALKGIDLSVRRGEVFCLLGPNGAGKTTTIEVLEGHRPYDAGEVRVLGHDPASRERSFRQRIGIVLQASSVERFLTVEEVVELFRGYYPHPRPLDEVLDMVGLSDKRTSLVRRLSGGQVRRLDVALALAGDPDLLFLDEPTSGFDPSARRGAWAMIEALRSTGKTIVLTTHYMDEAEHLSDRLAVIVNGEIVAQGTVASLRAGRGRTLISFRAPPRHPPPDILQGASMRNGRLTIETDAPTSTLRQLTGWATEAGLELEELRVQPTSLEDIYLSLAAAQAGPEE